VFGDRRCEMPPAMNTASGRDYQVPISNATLLRFDVMHGFLENASDVSGARAEFRWEVLVNCRLRIPVFGLQFAVFNPHSKIRHLKWPRRFAWPFRSGRRQPPALDRLHMIIVTRLASVAGRRLRMAAAHCCFERV